MIQMNHLSFSTKLNPKKEKEKKNTLNLEIKIIFYGGGEGLFPN